MQTLAGIRNAECGMRNAARRLRSATRRARVARSRRGFTLVEMLIVIVIIAVLMSLILPVLGNIRVRTNEAKVIVEIKQLEAAIAAFKSKYGVEPPSRIQLHTTAAGWTGDPASMAAIRRIWPQFDFTMSGPAGSYPSFWGEPMQLNSGECLLFFLGGVIPKAGTQQVPIGFAKNPQYPFNTTSTSREGPFFEFTDILRIKDIDPPPAGSGMNEWYDPLPDQSKPYLYFSSYEGRGYSLNELPMNSAGTAYTLLHDVYRVASAVGTNYPPASPGATPTGSQTQPAQRPQSFQIISPGYDQDYGFGGIFNPKLPNAGLTDPNGKPDKTAFDNLTNFNGGRLSP